MAVPGGGMLSCLFMENELVASGRPRKKPGVFDWVNYMARLNYLAVHGMKRSLLHVRTAACARLCPQMQYSCHV